MAIGSCIPSKPLAPSTRPVMGRSASPVSLKPSLALIGGCSMQTFAKLLGGVALAAAFSLPALAQTPPAPPGPPPIGSRPPGPNFAQHKQEMLQHLQARIQALQGTVNCVQGAANQEALRSCREQEKDQMEQLRPRR